MKGQRTVALLLRGLRSSGTVQPLPHAAQAEKLAPPHRSLLGTNAFVHGIRGLPDFVEASEFATRSLECCCVLIGDRLRFDLNQLVETAGSQQVNQ